MPTSAPHKLGVAGASGRLGSRLVELARQAGWTVSLMVSRRAGWRIEAPPQVVVDVSHPDALSEVAAYCARESVALVSATSGLQERDLLELRALAAKVPVVRAANLSLGHYLQTEALAAVARALAGRGGVRGAEVRVVDRHPATKHDRPSATAIQLAALWRDHGGEAVVESLRHGLPVADHQVGWAFEGEELVIEHRVLDRAAAARGALAAASWALGRPPGLATMNDVYR